MEATDQTCVSVSLSLNATTGNTEEQSLRFGVNASRRTPKTRRGLALLVGRCCDLDVTPQRSVHSF